MKIALINTSFRDIYGYEKMFPLGLGYIAAVLKQNGHEVSIIEPQIDNISNDELGGLIIEEKPDLIGISAVTPTFPEAVKIARAMRGRNIKTRIAIGGVHVSCFPERILNEYPEFDFAVFGEGEYTMLELCNKLEEEESDFNSVNGLCFRENGAVLKTRPRDYITDLDSIPMPARDLVDLFRYRLPLHIEKGKKSASVITSRGCPAKCVFCSSKVTMGHQFRPHSSEYVIKEIEHLISRYNVKHIQFVDDTFTISSERIKKICEEIIGRKIDLEWHCFARVETVSEELLLLMKQAGCSTILFGIESGDESVLKNIKKGINLKKAEEVHRICRKIGINVLSSFIFGNPGETRETANKTITFALNLKPTFALFYRLVPYPGSQAYEQYNREGRMKPNLDWDSYSPKGSNIVFDHENLSEKELGLLLVRAYRSFYLNPVNLFRILKSIESVAQLKVLLIGMYSIVKQMLKWKE